MQSIFVITSHAKRKTVVSLAKYERWIRKLTFLKTLSNKANRNDM